MHASIADHFSLEAGIRCRYALAFGFHLAVIPGSASLEQWMNIWTSGPISASAAARRFFVAIAELRHAALVVTLTVHGCLHSIRTCINSTQPASLDPTARQSSTREGNVAGRLGSYVFLIGPLFSVDRFAGVPVAKDQLWIGFRHPSSKLRVAFSTVQWRGASTDRAFGRRHPYLALLAERLKIRIWFVASVEMSSSSVSRCDSVGHGGVPDPPWVPVGNPPMGCLYCP